MKQEDKELLLQDLCSRLPYGVILNCCDSIGEKLTSIDENGLINHDYDIDEVKPYLFPMSSMTEEQKEDLLIHILGKKDCNLFQVLPDGSIDSTDTKRQKFEYFNFRWVNFDSETTSAYIDWCNKNHIDFRNLISKNLALDATGLNIY